MKREDFMAVDAMLESEEYMDMGEFLCVGFGMFFFIMAYGLHTVNRKRRMGLYH